MMIGSNPSIQPPRDNFGTKKPGTAESRSRDSGKATNLAPHETADNTAGVAIANNSASLSAQAPGPSDSGMSVQSDSGKAGFRVESAEQAARFIAQVKQTLLAKPGVALAAQASQMSQRALRLLA